MAYFLLLSPSTYTLMSYKAASLSICLFTLFLFQNHNMCVSTLLKYSPYTLCRIKNLTQGKQAYLVSGVPHMDDLAVADELGVPILGPEPAVAQLYGTKSGTRRVFTSAEISVPPGYGDIYTLQQVSLTSAHTSM